MSLGSLGSPKLLQSGIGPRGARRGGRESVPTARQPRAADAGAPSHGGQVPTQGEPRFKEAAGHPGDAGVDRAEVPRHQEGTAGRACRLPARRDHLSAGFASSMGPPVCRLAVSRGRQSFHSTPVARSSPAGRRFCRYRGRHRRLSGLIGERSSRQAATSVSLRGLGGGCRPLGETTHG